MNRTRTPAGKHICGLHNHRLADKFGRVWEHFLIVDKVIPGTFDPKKGHRIHHVDGNPKNNINSNLVVCESRDYHKLLHVKERALKACGNSSWRVCSRCGIYAPMKELKKRVHKATNSFEHKPYCKVQSIASGRPSKRIQEKAKELLDLIDLLEED
jgi:hypothetical protein